MGNSTMVTSGLYVALAMSGLLMSTGCETGGAEYADPVSLEIRFDGGAAPHDTVARILVDVTAADGPPIVTDLELPQFAPDVWRRDVPFLPRNQRLRFAARALDATGELAFSGETRAILTTGHQDLQIPLTAVKTTPPFQLPRIAGIIYPADMFAGQPAEFAFTVQGEASAAIRIQITAPGSTQPATEFSPATGTVTLTRTVADFTTVYTPPDVTMDMEFEYQVTVTDLRAQSAVAITSSFRTHVEPRPAGTNIVVGTQPSVLFNPVILGLTANGSEAPRTVKLLAAVSAGSASDQLAFQWSYTPSPGTPAATFARSGQGNPGLLQGYTVAHHGIITLAVTDPHSGTTTVHYQLAPDQFADPVDHTSVDGRKPIGAGDAHTGVITGQNRTTRPPDAAVFRLVYPADMFAGQEEQVTFTLQGNASQDVAVQITPLAIPATSAAEFSAATGTVTLTSTVADFMTV
jgi:hypothetical protein